MSQCLCHSTLHFRLRARYTKAASAAKPVSTLNICAWHLARIVPTGCTFVRGLNSDAFRIQEGAKVLAWVPY